MKRILFCLMLGVAATLSYAQSHGGIIIPLSVSWDDETGGNNNPPKSPTCELTVSLDDHTLYFADTFSEVVAIELKDASGTVVYSTNLPIGTQTLVLPVTLSGTYTIYIYVGGLCYYGLITL